MNLYLSARAVSQLCRAPVALLTAYSGFIGHFLGPRSSWTGAAVLFLAVFLLACGASALNQYQERDIDRIMPRTAGRPLPRGTIQPVSGLLSATALILAGLIILLAAGWKQAFLLGCAAPVLYNVAYTGLKRVTAFAAVPGAMVGMLAPAMGWSSAGGAVSDPRLLALCFLIFLWQVPHFWLQVLRYGKEYEQAGLPSLSYLMSREQLSRMTFVWICATCASSLLLPLFGTLRTEFLSFLLLPACAALLIKGSGLLRGYPFPGAAAAFRAINVFLILVLSLLAIEGLLGLP